MTTSGSEARSYADFDTRSAIWIYTSIRGAYKTAWRMCWHETVWTMPLLRVGWSAPKTLKKLFALCRTTRKSSSVERCRYAGRNGPHAKADVRPHGLVVCRFEGCVEAGRTSRNAALWVFGNTRLAVLDPSQPRYAGRSKTGACRARPAWQIGDDISSRVPEWIYLASPLVVVRP